ncbi:tripartite tricarboxylate transporter TctB family protein [Roseovarius pacificus]|uniref:tripartite tricarboxylate transporter TctB family protein n=1 Tax=Roseovarius pacificus TaxID=337701 RepID=UPI00403A200B
MTNRTIQLQLGIGACVAALFLIFHAIPAWVSAPSNISNIILSPLFWPYTLAGVTILAGLGLIAAGLRAPSDDAPVNTPIDDTPAAWVRLASMAAIMTATMFLLPRLGMVWTSMLVFATTAFLFKTRHPLTAMICAVAVPLVLYAFFAHVAGVAIPQGHFVRLP